MNHPARRLADDADALRSAAQRLHGDTLDPASAALIPVTLAAIEDAVTTLSRTAYTAAHALVPPPSGDESVAVRYAHAATTWPSPRHGMGPSHEQLARVLSSLHDAGVALQTAAGRCGRARRNVAATMDGVERRSEAA